jgi:iron complex outermembrane recepter protein
MKRIHLMSTAALLAFAHMNTAIAQESADKAGSQSSERESILSEDIVVVAQKRAQSAQDVGISIAAYSGEQLQALGIETGQDIAAITPGVHISGALGGQLQTFTIRGVAQSDFVETSESPNAVYADEAYISYISGGQFATFDTRRIEILKGPQGTLFGRNATGGLVHYLSNRPTANWDGQAKLTYGSFNQVRTEAAIGGPITDTIRFRIAGLYNRHDGWLKNDFPGGFDANNDNRYGIRAMLDFDVGSSFKVLLKGEIGRARVAPAIYQSSPTIAIVNANGAFTDTIFAAPDETRLGIGPGGANVCPGCLTANPTRPVPGGDFSGGPARDPSVRRVNSEFSDPDSNRFDSNSLTSIITGDLGGIELTSVTDYRSYNKTTLFENDGQPYYHLTSFAFTKNRQFSQELRLAGQSNKLRWSTGLYYLHYNTDVESGFFTGIGNNPSNPLQNPLLNPAIPPLNLAGVWFQNDPRLKTDSYSAFAQLELDLSETLRLVAGGRYTREEKAYSHDAVAYLVDQNPATSLVESYPVNRGALLFQLDPKKTFDTGDDLWSGKVQLEWRPQDDLLLYAGINRGVKAGSFNQDYGGLAGGLGTRFPAAYAPETLLAYETGFKSSLLDRKLRLNGSAYYYDYSDFQAFRYSGLSFFVTNNKARAYGAELDLVANPVDGLEFVGSAAYTNFLVKDVVFDAGTRNVRPPYAPQWQLNGLGRYTWGLGGGYMTVQADVSFTDSFYISATNFTSTKTSPYALFGFRIAFETADKDWKIEAFGKNVGDKFYKTIGFDLTNLWGLQQFARGNPRWFGVSVTKKLF